MVKLNLIGHIGQDCVVNNVNGKTVINFSVAHTEKWTNSAGQQQEKSLWVSCSYWSERTNLASYLKKGTQVYVEGVPDVKTYTTGRGEVLPQMTLRVQMVQLLGTKDTGFSKQKDEIHPVMKGAATQIPADEESPF